MSYKQDFTDMLSDYGVATLLGIMESNYHNFYANQETQSLLGQKAFNKADSGM